MIGTLKVWIGGLTLLGKAGLMTATVAVSSLVMVPVATRCSDAPTTHESIEIQSINPESTYLKDGSINTGEQKIKSEGVSGEKKVAYKVTTKCNKELSKSLVSEEQTKQALNTVILKGTRSEVIETQPIAFSKREINDDSLAYGQKKLVAAGVNGTKSITYVVSQDEGKEETKVLSAEKSTVQPIDEVYGVGPKCDPNYSGTCVPNVYPQDVDCGSGSGNGPYYIYGTARVIGIDRYGLDSDADGFGCE